jgi:hypothetical protein
MMIRKVFILVPLVLSGCVRPDKLSSQPGPAEPVFNVPVLLTKNIDQIVNLLGKPVLDDMEPSAEDIIRGSTEWERSFKRDTTTLFVTYDTRTRQVLHVYISTDHHRMKSYLPLLQLVNVHVNEPKLLIEPQQVPGSPQLYDGVKVSIAQKL